jgi:hypothetical protein
MRLTKRPLLLAIAAACAIFPASCIPIPFPLVYHTSPEFEIDSFDWWSLSSPASDYLRQEASVTNIAAPAGLLGVTGVALGPAMDSSAQQVLGAGTSIARDDGRGTRALLCYRSISDSPATYLIFETAPNSRAYYLLAGEGPAWDGQTQCAPDMALTRTTANGAGLRLGMSREFYRGILGKPSVVRSNSILWTYDETGARVLVRVVFEGTAAISIAVMAEERPTAISGK